MKKILRGDLNYKGKIEKDTRYTIKAEGRDWYQLIDNTYIPKFVLSPVYDNEIEYDEEEYSYDDDRKKPPIRKNNSNTKYPQRNDKTKPPKLDKRIQRNTRKIQKDVY